MAYFVLAVGASSIDRMQTAKFIALPHFRGASWTWFTRSFMLGEDSALVGMGFDSVQIPRVHIWRWILLFNSVLKIKNNITMLWVNRWIVWFISHNRQNARNWNWIVWSVWKGGRRCTRLVSLLLGFESRHLVLLQSTLFRTLAETCRVGIERRRAAIDDSRQRAILRAIRTWCRTRAQSDIEALCRRLRSIRRLCCTPE